MHELINRIKEYYKKPGNEAGGNCHIVLDDGNLSLKHIDYCRKICMEQDDSDGIFILGSLGALSYRDRIKLWRQL